MPSLENTVGNSLPLVGQKKHKDTSRPQKEGMPPGMAVVYLGMGAEPHDAQKLMSMSSLVT